MPPEHLRYLLEVVRSAPSGANRQPWRFLVVLDPARKAEIRRRCEEAEKRFHERVDNSFKAWLRSRGISWRKPFLTEAPALILVFGDRRQPYWLASTWVAVAYLILAAEELGYGTLTYTPSDVKWVNPLFQIPEDYILQVIVPVGKPAEKPEHPGRLPLNEVAYLDEWGRGFKL